MMSNWKRDHPLLLVGKIILIENHHMIEIYNKLIKLYSINNIIINIPFLICNSCYLSNLSWLSI